MFHLYFNRLINQRTSWELQYTLFIMAPKELAIKDNTSIYISLWSLSPLKFEISGGTKNKNKKQCMSQGNTPQFTIFMIFGELQTFINGCNVFFPRLIPTMKEKSQFFFCLTQSRGEKLWPNIFRRDILDLIKTRM